MYEAMSEVYKLVIPIHESRRAFDKLEKLHGKLQTGYQRIVARGDKRLLGSFFRVGFYGSLFNDLDKMEFVYKEEGHTRLAEFSLRLEVGVAHTALCGVVYVAVVLVTCDVTFIATPTSPPHITLGLQCHTHLTTLQCHTHLTTPYHLGPAVPHPPHSSTSSWACSVTPTSPPHIILGLQCHTHLTTPHHLGPAVPHPPHHPTSPEACSAPLTLLIASAYFSLPSLTLPLLPPHYPHPLVCPSLLTPPSHLPPQPILTPPSHLPPHPTLMPLYTPPSHLPHPTLTPPSSSHPILTPPSSPLPPHPSLLQRQYMNRVGENNVVIIKDSNPVSADKLDPTKAYIQITYVEPYFADYEMNDRVTSYDRTVNVREFTNHTPYMCACGYVGMYMCACGYVHVCMWVCGYVHVCVYACTCVHVGMYTCACGYVHVCMWVCTHVRVCMHVHVCVYVCMRVRVAGLCSQCPTILHSCLQVDLPSERLSQKQARLMAPLRTSSCGGPS